MAWTQGKRSPFYFFQDLHHTHTYIHYTVKPMDRQTLIPYTGLDPTPSASATPTICPLKHIWLQSLFLVTPDKSWTADIRI